MAGSRKEKLADQWFKRALSNLARAKQELPEGAVYEDSCFDAQQAAEKALKSLCVLHGIRFPYTYDILKLLDLLEKEGVQIPSGVHEATTLTDYAVVTRYPGWGDPVSAAELKKAVALADRVCKWVGEAVLEVGREKEQE